ncbi:MAG: response regulator [Planctomycetota bacterium]|nr:MAG: response regulator [Planctomycetota bacterium]REK46612.1 MAG: response regulator [Planctomycetota bacterium]
MDALKTGCSALASCGQSCLPPEPIDARKSRAWILDALGVRMRTGCPDSDTFCPRTLSVAGQLGSKVANDAAKRGWRKTPCSPKPLGENALGARAYSAARIGTPRALPTAEPTQPASWSIPDTRPRSNGKGNLPGRRRAGAKTSEEMVLRKSTRTRNDIVIVDKNFADYTHLLSSPVADQWNFHFLRTGSAALRHATTGSVDLWLINAELSDMSGFELHRHLRKQRQRRPVILVADRYDRQNELNAFTEQVTAYVTKPIDVAWLQEKPSGTVSGRA